MTVLVIRGESSCLQVQAPGFFTEIRLGAVNAIPLTQCGRSGVVSVAGRLALSPDDLLLLDDALRAIPQTWCMSFSGIASTVAAAATGVLAALSAMETGLVLHHSQIAPSIEAAITDKQGEVLVLLQQCGHEGTPRSERNANHMAIHVNRREHMGVVAGAIHRLCQSAASVLVTFNEVTLGIDPARWDFSRKDQVRAFLEEVEPQLDNFKHCHKAGLMEFCRIDLWPIAVTNKNPLDF